MLTGSLKLTNSGDRIDELRTIISITCIGRSIHGNYMPHSCRICGESGDRRLIL